MPSDASPAVLPNGQPPEILGFFPSDIILKSALVIGMQDLRATQNRWILEKTFTNQTQDPLTSKQYGGDELNQAIKWFLDTQIPIFMGAVREDTFRIPSITIELLDSSEDTNTLADIHYQPWEDVNSPVTPQIFGTLTPLAYDVATGTITIPPSQVGVLPLMVGMVLVEAQTNKQWPILSILSANQFTIPANSVVNLNNCTLQANQQITPSWTVLAHSAIFKESYRIGVHVNSEPAHLIYLHDIIRMILLGRRQDLLEARGLERTTISSSDFAKNFQLEGNVAFSRFITVNGFIRQSWPAVSGRNLRSQGVSVNITNSEADTTSPISVNVNYQNT